MSFFNAQPVNDIDKARIALIAFHNQACAFSPKYSQTLDGLIKVVGENGRGSDPTIFMESFGFAINTIGMTINQSEQAMRDLAVQAQGGIPRQSEFFKGLATRISNPTLLDYVKATPQVAGQSALDVVHGFKEVGDAVLDTGKSLLIIGPLLIVAAVIFIGYRRTKMFAG